MPVQLLEKAAKWSGHDCLLCGSASGAAFVCSACEARLPRHPLGGEDTLAACRALDDAEAAFDYRFPVDRLILRFKFAGDLAHASLHRLPGR